MTTVYGIKNCDTVKKTLKWLTAQEIEHSFHDIRVNGLDADKINTWLSKVDLTTLLNKRSTTYKQLSEAEKESISPETITELFLTYPTLIKRPVLELNNDVIVGFKVTDYEQRFK